MNESDIDREKAARAWEAGLYDEVIHAIEHPELGVFCSVNFLIAEGVVFFLNVPWMRVLPGDPTVVFEQIQAAGKKCVSCELLAANNNGHIPYFAMSSAVKYAIGWYDSGLKIKLDDEQYSSIVSKAVRSLREKRDSDRESKKLEMIEKDNDREAAINGLSSLLINRDECTYVVIGSSGNSETGALDFGYIGTKPDEIYKVFSSESKAINYFNERSASLKSENENQYKYVADCYKEDPEGCRQQAIDYGEMYFYYWCCLLKLPAKLESASDVMEYVENFNDEREEFAGEAESYDDACEIYNEAFRRFVIDESSDDSGEYIYLDMLLGREGDC